MFIKIKDNNKKSRSRAYGGWVILLIITLILWLIENLLGFGVMVKISFALIFYLLLLED